MLKWKLQNTSILAGQGICSINQTKSDNLDETFPKLVSLGDIENQEVGPAIHKDITTGFKLYHTIVYCPVMDFKLYSFVDQLLSSESKRTLIQSYTNLFHSGVLKGTTSITLAKEFYIDLAATLNLQYGNILLATSTTAQIQAVIDNDWPFFGNNTNLVKASTWDSESDRLQEIFEDLGKILSSLYILTKSTVTGENNISRKVSINPVHLKPDTEENLSPSALVPFCSYNRDQSHVGNELQDFTLCDKFEPTILEGQLCYSLDVTTFERKVTGKGKQSGLFLLLDPNPYPMQSFDIGVKAARNDQESFKVYIHTLAGHTAFGPGAYAMHTLKRMTGKQNFYDLPDSQKECQVHSRENCQTAMLLMHVKTNCSCVPWALRAEDYKNEVIRCQESNFYPKGDRILWTEARGLCFSSNFETQLLFGCL